MAEALRLIIEYDADQDEDGEEGFARLLLAYNAALTAAKAAYAKAKGAAA
jgi:hypothetical protein